MICRKVLTIIVSSFALAGCAEYVATELAVHAISAGVDYAKSQSSSSTSSSHSYQAANMSDDRLCANATLHGKWETNPRYQGHINEAKRRGLSCGVGENYIVVNSIENYSSWSNDAVCIRATHQQNWEIRGQFLAAVQEAKRRGLNCGVGGT